MLYYYKGGFISSLVKQTPLQTEPEPEKEDESTLPTVEVCVVIWNHLNTLFTGSRGDRSD